MAEEKGVAYIFGILSIVLAFFQPFPGIIIGIIGLVQNRKEKSKTAKMLNTVGIIIGVAVIILLLLLTKYLASKNITFPTYYNENEKLAKQKSRNGINHGNDGYYGFACRCAYSWRFFG